MKAYIDPIADNLLAQIPAFIGQLTMHWQGFEADKVLIGDVFKNVLVGDVGNDVLVGGYRGDGLFGGAGRDFIVTDGGLYDEHRDHAYGGAGADSLYGGINDRLNGGAGDDIMFGASNANGGAGDDQFYVDYYQFYASNVNGGSGNDVIQTSWGDDVLIGGSGKDSLYGGGGNDTLIGGTGKDVLAAGSGINLVVAGHGDTIIFDFTGEQSFTEVKNAAHVADIVLYQAGEYGVSTTQIGDDLLVTVGNDRVLFDNMTAVDFFEHATFGYGGKG